MTRKVVAFKLPAEERAGADRGGMAYRWPDEWLASGSRRPSGPEAAPAIEAGGASLSPALPPGGPAWSELQTVWIDTAVAVLQRQAAAVQGLLSCRTPLDYVLWQGALFQEERRFQLGQTANAARLFASMVDGVAGVTPGRARRGNGIEAP